MNIKSKNLWEGNANPFEGCQLERKQYAEVLTNLVTNYPSGFVLAINNEWGTGKTTFVQMWKQYLAEKEFKTVYFNAWENDFEDNPLVAIIGELKALFGNDNSERFEKLLEYAATLSKGIIPALIKGAVKNYIDTDTFVETITEGSKGLIEVFDKEVDDYATRKQNIEKFKQSLAELLKANTPDKPLVFIIDELDRCRPNYAVSVLEQVKHLFSVSNIVFVLSIDKKQLSHAICGVYGSEKIDTTEYLRRFIDIEYSLPEPNNKEYFDYLYTYYGLGEFLSENRIGDGKNNNLRNILRLLLINAKLRQQEKILTYTRIMVRTFSSREQFDLGLVGFLIYVKFLHLDFYNDLKQHIPIENMHKKFVDLLGNYTFLGEDIADIRWLESFLLKHYCYNWGRSKGEGLLFEKDDNSKGLIVKFPLKYATNQQILEIIMSGMDKTPLDNFIKKVDMLDNFVV